MEKKKDSVTIDDLQKAINSDSSNGRVKEIAELFVIAMNDWPTLNQTQIREFVSELEEFYGYPITCERIDNKNQEIAIEQDIWRHESGSSIAEVIDISSRFENENDFEKIVQGLIDYCE